MIFPNENIPVNNEFDHIHIHEANPIIPSRQHLYEDMERRKKPKLFIKRSDNKLDVHINDRDVSETVEQCACDNGTSVQNGSVLKRDDFSQSPKRDSNITETQLIFEQILPFSSLNEYTENNVVKYKANVLNNSTGFKGDAAQVSKDFDVYTSSLQENFETFSDPSGVTRKPYTYKYTKSTGKVQQNRFDNLSPPKELSVMKAQPRTISNASKGKLRVRSSKTLPPPYYFELPRRPKPLDKIIISPCI